MSLQTIAHGFFDPALGAARLPARPWRLGLLVAAVAVVAYLPSMRNLPTLDDTLITSTSFDRQHAPLSTLFDAQFFPRYNQDTYRPFATLTTMVDYRLGVDPRHAGHIQNILWHAGACFLLVLLARLWLPAGAALFSGLFFAVHPGATEAAVSIGYREDTIVAFFLVAALLLTWTGAVGPRLLALLCYALALFTKENAIVLPALLVLARLTVGRRGPLDKRALAREMGAFALVTVGYLVVRFGVMASPAAFADAKGGSFADTFVAVPKIFAHYLRLLVAPWPLLALYDHTFPMGASFVSQLPWVLLDVAFLVGAVRLARWDAVLGLGLLWFAVALLPVLHFVPMRVTAADRFVHVSLVGGALAAGALFARAQAAPWHPEVQRAFQVAAAATLLTLLALTERRIPVWHDDLTLWKDTLRHNPRAYLGHYYVAVQAEAEGQTAHAEQELMRAVTDCPRESHFGRERFCAYFSSKLGFLYLKDRNPSAASQAFVDALDFVPDYAIGFVGLGHVSLAFDDVEKARRFAKFATMADPHLELVRSMIEDLNADIDAAATARARRREAN